MLFKNFNKLVKESLICEMFGRVYGMDMKKHRLVEIWNDILRLLTRQQDVQACSQNSIRFLWANQATYLNANMCYPDPALYGSWKKSRSNPSHC